MRIQPRPYRFTLIGKHKYSQDEVLESIALPYGWKNYNARWKMERRYFGCGYSGGVDFRFYTEAAAFLRRYFDNFGINARVVLKVEKGNMDTYQYDFEAEFDINFNSYTSHQHYVEVGLLSRGLLTILSTNEKNTYDISMMDGEVVHVGQGINLPENADYSSFSYGYTVVPTSYIYTQDGEITVEGSVDKDDFLRMKLDEKASNIETFNFEFGSQDAIGKPFFSIRDKIEGEDYFTLKLSASALFDVVKTQWYSYNGDIKVTISLKKDFGGNNTETIVLFEDNFSPDNPRNFSFNYDIIAENKKTDFYIEANFIVPDDYIYKYYEYLGKTIVSDAPLLSSISVRGESLNIEYFGAIVTPPFSFRAYQLKDWFQKIFNEMRGDNDYNFVDEIQDGGQHYLSQYKDRIMVTSADAIRGIDNAVGKGCFSDFYDALTGVIGCGAAIENDKIYLLPKERIFDPNTEIINIGSVSRPIVHSYTDMIKNRLKFGYPNKDYDKLHGRHEFNTTVEFVSPSEMANENEQSFVGKYRADSFGIQWLRREYEKKSSTDSPSDNDMFFVAVRRTSDGRIAVEQNIIINSIESDIGQKGLFNFFLSPKRNMLRNKNLLAAYYDKLPAQSEIRFTSSEKVDSKLISHIYDEEGAFIEETSDVPIYKLGEKLFRPLVFEVESAVQFSLPDTMKKPHGYIRFNYFGLELKGFVDEVFEASTPKKAQIFKLIAHPDTPDNVCELIAIAGHGKTPI